MVASVSLPLDDVGFDNFVIKGLEESGGQKFFSIALGLKISADSLLDALRRVHSDAAVLDAGLPDTRPARSPALTPADLGTQDVVVKNTFVTLPEDRVPLARTTTSPPTFLTQESPPSQLSAKTPKVQEEEDEEEAEEEVEHANVVHPPGLQRASSSSLTKDPLARASTLDWFEEPSSAVSQVPAADAAAAAAAAMTNQWMAAGAAAGAMGCWPPMMDPSTIAMMNWQYGGGAGWYTDPTYQMDGAAAASAAAASGAAPAAPSRPPAVVDPQPPQKGQPVRQAFSVSSGLMQVQWPITEELLASTDEDDCVSSTFNMFLGGYLNVPFKMRIRPRTPSTGKSIKEQGGLGLVELISEQGLDDSVPEVKFNLALGEGTRKQSVKQPVLHDFAKEPVCGLPRAVWDFGAALSRKSRYTVLCLEILPTSNTLSVVASSDAEVSRPTDIEESEEEYLEDAGAKEGHAVKVRNTFITVDDDDHEKPPGLLLRTRTAPPSSGFGQDMSAEIPGSDNSSGVVALPPTVPEGADPFQQSMFGIPGLGNLSVENIMQSEPPPVRPQMLHPIFDPETACMRFEWVVSSRKLSSTDTHAHVSPAFDLSLGDEGPVASFKLMISPLVVNAQKGGASFKKAGGRGYVDLACQNELPQSVPPVRFRIGIGTGERKRDPRGPVTHNFAEKAVSGLPKKDGLWDFNLAVDKGTHTFVVCLEILAGCEETVAKKTEKPKRW